MFTFRLLGGASLEGPNGPVAGPPVQPARLALLALLAVPRARSVPRDKLVALLWPERSAPRGRRALSDGLYVLRQTLGDDAVRSLGDSLLLDPDRVVTDVSLFRQALGRGAPLEAVEAYGGPLLDGVHLRDSVAFERWVDRERERLASQFRRALESLAQTAEDAGDLEEALGWRRRLVAERPYSTAAVIALMRTLERTGDPAAAVRVARLHERRLRQELQAEPDPDLLEELDRIRTAPSSGAIPENAVDAPTDADPRAGGASTDADDAEPAPPSRRLRVGAVVLLAAALGVGYLGLRAAGVLGPEDRPPIRSIAVLPLASHSPAPETDGWFADGMTEALTAELGRVEELDVISWTSARRFDGTDRTVPDIARQLDVDALIEGSVVRDSDEVRIALQLIDGRTDRRVWSRSYRRAFRDVVGLQSEVVADVTREIAGSVESAALPAGGDGLGPTAADEPNSRAYEAYLKGRYHFDRWGSAEFEKAMRLYREAIAIDSTFALAHAALADVCLRPAIYEVHMSLEECRASARRAVALDERSAEAHAALGRVRTRQWDWDGAEAAFRRAIDLNPNSALAHRWYATLLSTRREREQALREIRRAEELDPLNLHVKTVVAVHLARLGRSAEADAQLDEVLEMDPDFVLAHLVSATMGDPSEALEHARFAVSRLERDPVRPRLVTAVVRARRGDRTRAARILRSVEEDLPRRPDAPIGFVAIVHHELGQDDQALDWLEKGIELRSMSLASVTSDPVFDDLRAHPRFRAIRRRMGLR